MAQSNFLHEALRKTVNNKDFFLQMLSKFKILLLRSESIGP